MSEDLRRLVVMRHAKAEAVAASDHQRRLTPRGQRDAEEAGRWARAQALLPDHALVSTAARAHQTWESFARGADLAIEADLDSALYAAGPDSALELLRSAPPEARTLMVVGHNPTMAHLVHLLDDGSAEPAAFAAISEGFPTSAVAVLDVAGEWSDLELAGARVCAFHIGRG